MLCAAVALTAGCADEKAGGSMSEKVYAALTWHDDAIEYDRAGQMRLAELYYRKSYEILKDNPSQDWDIYAEAGYRYACMLYQRDDMEGVLTVVNEMLDKAEGQKDFPTSVRTGLLSLMAQCQVHLAMPEAAKQTFAKAYQNELTVLGGEEKGDFNLAILCSNIFYSLFEIGEYDEAKKWLDRYECEILACEKLGIGDSALIEEHKGSIALYKARYLQATGRMGEAATVYAAIPRSRIFMGENMLDATGYLKAAGRYDEAAYWYEQSDSTFLTTIGTETTFDNIVFYLSPRYFVYRKAGRISEALVMADSINAAIDSALAWQKQNDAAELAVIYQTHEKDLALEESEARATIYHIILVSAVIIILLIAYLLLRAYKYNKVLAEKNRRLLAEIEQREQEQQQTIKQLEAAPEAELTTGQQLYRRLCELMKNPDVFTDPETNPDTLARLVGTNRTYIYDALHECANQTPSDFINAYRLRHAAHLLSTTADSVALIAELCGLSRRTFYRLFSETYGMSPSDYREVVAKK